MTRLSSLGVLWLVLLALPAARAAAYCQSLSVTPPTSNQCDAPCLTLDDFTPEEIASRRIVPLAWERGCFSWTLHPRGTEDLPRADVIAAIERSFDVWASVDCGVGPVGVVAQRRDVPDLQCAYVDHARGDENVNVIVFADDWAGRHNPPTAFALTTTWFDPNTGEIFGADMELNDQRRAWAICPPEGCDDGRADLQNVLVHEMGHWFGLAHSPSDPEATMWACSESGEVLKRDLHADDVAGWCGLYAVGLDPTCPAVGDPPLTCRFLGSSCDPTRPSATCASGYCEDLGRGPECTMPCEGAADVCPGGFACEPAGEGGALRCVSTGCGCRVGAARGAPAWMLFALVLVGLRGRPGQRARRSGL